MAKRVECPACGQHHLKRIGVPGIKKCSTCGTLVDVRTTAWWRRWLSA
ncbi:MAG: hypothetical protein AAGH78_06275 [Cyanobacteria bacterium P01_H01_bin.58]